MAGNTKRPEGTRMLLGKQPVRMLLVEVVKPLISSTEVVNDLCKTLENVFSIATNIGGPSRMPFFSLMSLKHYPELLLPLTHVKNNFNRIQSAISDLYNGIHDNSWCVADNRGCIIQGLQEACAHFHRQLKTMVPTMGGLCNQLEVILLTSQNSQKVQKQIEEAVMLMNLENIKRIQVVALNIEEDTNVVDCEILGSQNSITSNNSSISGGLVDIVQLETDALSLQNFFNSWLLDTSTESEHLHIVLPSTVSEGRNLTIKCDLRERILNPAQLPFHSSFTIHPDSATMKTFPSTSKALGMSIPVYRIRVCGLLPAQDLCDSVVFGMPMIAVATNCWKIDWDDLEKNQQLFKALCYKLVEKDQVMLGELDTLPPVNRSRQDQEEKPKGRYVFLPAPNGTLLIKSLAVQELLLPCQTGTSLDGATEESLDVITDAFCQMEELESYNPLSVSSGLYQCLKNKNRKPEPKQQKRKSENTANREVLSASTKYNNIPGTGRTPKASPVSTSVKKLRPLLNIFPTDL